MVCGFTIRSSSLVDVSKIWKPLDNHRHSMSSDRCYQDSKRVHHQTSYESVQRIQCRIYSENLYRIHFLRIVSNVHFKTIDLKMPHTNLCISHINASHRLCIVVSANPGIKYEYLYRQILQYKGSHNNVC